MIVHHIVKNAHRRALRFLLPGLTWLCGCGSDHVNPSPDMWSVEEVVSLPDMDMAMVDQDTFDMQDMLTSPEENEICQVPNQLGRCSVGRWKYVNGTFFCQAIYRAMPEVCNGEDSDCNGQADYDDWSSDDNPETRRARFEEFSMIYLNAGASVEELQELRELYTCSGFGICSVLVIPPPEIPLQPYDDPYQELQEFMQTLAAYERVCF